MNGYARQYNCPEEEPEKNRKIMEEHKSPSPNSATYEIGQRPHYPAIVASNRRTHFAVACANCARCEAMISSRIASKPRVIFQLG